MFSYNGSEFVKIDKFTILFDTVRDRKENWMVEYPILWWFWRECGEE